ncbi:MAG TPA: DoxX family protein [Afifellaceae bacterium]|nr:DoxX family protein [Afifellaceae bacterium]
MGLENRLSAWSPQVLSLLRIMSALLLMQHGTQKLLNFPPADDWQFPEILSLRFLAGVLELFGGGLLALGLFTRPVAFILSGFTAVAYFMAHAPRSFFPIENGGELAALYCFIFFYFIFAGGGAWSVDAARSRR